MEVRRATASNNHPPPSTSPLDDGDATAPEPLDAGDVSLDDDDGPPAPGASKQSRLNRRRSRKACYSCHARKVRCDVTHRGAPCTNCKDDHVPCIIRERKNRR